MVYIGGDSTSVNGIGSAGKLVSLSIATATINTTFRSGATNLQCKAPAQDLDLRGGDLLLGGAGYGGGCAMLDATTGAMVVQAHEQRRRGRRLLGSSNLTGHVVDRN